MFKHSLTLIGVTLLIILNVQAWAQTAPPPALPAPADAGRINKQEQENLRAPQTQTTLPSQSGAVSVQAPPNADQIKFTLRAVIFKGASVYSSDELLKPYENLLNKTVDLSLLWKMAADITSKYQNDGYFLSKAFVPLQEIDNGIIQIHIVEGYVDEVKLENLYLENRIINALKARITDEKPIKITTLENALLLLNDIPGYEFETLLKRADNTDKDGATVLFLKKKDTKAKGTAFTDNHGSRFTGPYRSGAIVEHSFRPFHQTFLSTSASIPDGDEVWSASIGHTVLVGPETRLRFTAGQTRSQPGFQLSQSEVESNSLILAGEIIWQAIRQRQTNLSLGLGFELNNVNTDILQTALTRDRIRIVEANLNYSTTDRFNGFNTLTATLSRGIKGLGANNSGDLNLSRPEAEPNFTKAAINYQRQQFVTPDILFTTKIQGQYASKELYSSEEFGFGGASLGRAYDFSEITGDHGIAGAIEFQYYGLESWKNWSFAPGAFIDAGKVWNIDEFQLDSVSAISSGLTLNFSHISGISGSLIMAQPLTKSIDTPTQGNNGKNPRYYLQLDYDF